MRNVMTIVAAASLAFGLPACSEVAENSAEVGSIEGSWKTIPDSWEFENAENRHFTLVDGTFSCESCEPSYSIPADGSFHAVNQPGFADEQSIQVVDQRSLRGARKIAGEEIGNAIWSVSDDGQTLEIEWTYTGGEEPVSGTNVHQRMEAGPERAHAISGVWSLSERIDTSDAGQGVTYTLDGNTLTAKHNDGGYTATLGGEAVVPEGDEAGGLLAVEKTGDNSYRETYTIDGEVQNVLDITVDGDTLHYESTYQPSGEITRWSAARQ